ncbi:MAG: ATP-binding cassette domain-containing protein, partial [Lachnospiraceae bacterium]|nr:ATP-binding cassette domain-containing protein [Lachnospiraceae bacterium]
MKSPYMVLEHISFSYHNMQAETIALSDISFYVNKGEFIAIVGPSGCGKSTLLSIIAGLLTPEEGKITFPDMKDSSKPQIGYMLQHDHLFEWRTVYKNVILGLEINHMMTPERLAYVDKLLHDYELEK